jgi:hypothetical protein
MTALRQLSIGFQGGLALSVRVPEEQLEGLYGALGTSGWYALDSDDGPVRLELSQVVYVRADVDDQRVGFG